MLSPKTTVTVVIPTYNRPESLKRTLQSVARQSYDPALMEVVVADNGSTEDTAEIVRHLTPPYKLVYLPVLKRFPSDSPVARNAGSAKATGELLIFLDDDEFVRPHFVAEHVSCHQHDRHALVAGGVFHVLNQAPVQDHALRDTNFEQIGGGLAPWQAGMVEFCGNLRTCRYPWSYCFGGNYSLRKEDLLRVGGIDEEFASKDIEGHDTEFAYRCYRGGLRVIFTRNALTYHDWRGSPKQNYEERTRRVVEGFCYAREKHGTAEFQEYVAFRTGPYESQLRALLRCSKSHLFPVFDRCDTLAWMDQIMTCSRPILSILVLAFTGLEPLIETLLALDGQDTDHAKFEVLVYDFSAPTNFGSPRNGLESDVMVQMLGVGYGLRYFPAARSEPYESRANSLQSSIGSSNSGPDCTREPQRPNREWLREFRSVGALSDSLSRIGWYYSTLHAASLGSRLRGRFVRVIDDQEPIQRSFVRDCMALMETDSG